MKKSQFAVKIGILVGYVSWIVAESFFLLPHTGIRIVPHLFFALFLGVLFWWGTLFSLESGPVEARFLKVFGSACLFVSFVGFYQSHILAPQIERYPSLVEQVRRMRAIYRVNDWQSIVWGLIGILFWAFGVLKKS